MVGMNLRIRQIFDKYKFLLLFLTLGFWKFPFLTFLPNNGLDPSWGVGINLALINNLQFGTDFLFTYGILGFMASPLVLDYNLWIMSLFFSIFTHFLFIIAVYLFLNHFSARWYLYILFIPILFLILPNLGGFRELFISVSIFLFLILRQKNPQKSDYIILALCGFLLAVDSLIKYDMLWNSIFLLFGFCVICSFLKRNIWLSIILIISSVCSFFTIWFFSHQRVSQIIPFLLGGFELTRGYTEAMASPGPLWQVCVGLVSITVILIVALFFVKSDNQGGFLFIIMNIFLLFTAFKAGFVRHDLHVLEFFFVFLLFFGFSLVIILNSPEKKKNKYRHIVKVLVVLCIGILIVSTFITIPKVMQNNVITQSASHDFAIRLLSNQTYFDERVDQQKEIVRKYYSLKSSISQNISNSSIDIFPWDASLIWAYTMNWSPRPVFQSYTVYTPYLDSINSHHFSFSTESPEKILYSYGSIDGRYPLFDEPKTFRTILETYSYAGRSGAFILLKRTQNPSKTSEIVLGCVTATMGRPAVIPAYNGPVYGNFLVKYSLWGNLLKVIYKPAPVYIRFELKDGKISPRYRFIPETASDGLLLSKYVSNTEALESVFQRQYTNDIEKIIIETDHPLDYQDEIQIQFSTLTVS